MQKTKQFRKQTVSLKFKHTQCTDLFGAKGRPEVSAALLRSSEAAEFLKQVVLPLPGGRRCMEAGFPIGSTHRFTRRPAKLWRTGLNSAGGSGQRHSHSHQLATARRGG